MTPTQVLIIDDEDKIRNLLTRIIALEGFDVHNAPDARTGMKLLETKSVDVVLCDVKLPDGNGVDLVKTIKEKYPEKEVILLTAYGNIPDGVMAIKNGAFDYIVKGDDNAKILPLINNAAQKVALAKRVIRLEKQLGERQSFDRIIGKSKKIQDAIATAKKVANTTTTVLLNGETGTGKEIFAQAIHTASSRASQNFIAVNCAAFSKELLENELFGHKAGAFTGAIKDTKGIFEEANGGTVFLDEIGEMPIDLQAKLLRVLETGEFLKVGDSKTTNINVRIIAATNKDLQKEVNAGNFREDLFYRIAVFQIVLPSLSERVEDIEELALFFLNIFAGKTNKKITYISAEYLSALKLHPWKGNIRELKNVIERSVILHDGNELDFQSLPLTFQHIAGLTETLGSQNTSGSGFDLAGIEKAHIQKVMAYTSGNKTEAARQLNIALTTLYRKLEEYKIK